jgi:hypothetical protein
VDANTREIARNKELVELYRPCDRFDEDYHLKIYMTEHAFRANIIIPG